MTGKMVISIVHPEDAQGVIKALNADGFRVTQASTSGGFLRQGNVTLLTGVEEEQVDRVMEIVKANTKVRSRGGWWLRPGRHEIHPTVFVINAERA